MDVAASVREHKARHPQLYCAEPKCLWRIITRQGANPCRNHPLPNAPDPAPKIDLAEFANAFLDGAIGDSNPTTQDDAIADVEQLLVARIGRPLTASESVKVGFAVAVEWNRREAAACETMARQRREWLADFQAGDLR